MRNHRKHHHHHVHERTLLMCIFSFSLSIATADMTCSKHTSGVASGMTQLLMKRTCIRNQTTLLSREGMIDHRSYAHNLGSCEIKD